MPRRDQHLARAEENESLAWSLDQESEVCRDWAVTMFFYAALHYIDAFLAGKGLHPLNHKHRDGEIERNGSISEIWPDYRRLKDLSTQARYDIACHSPDKVRVASEKLKRIEEFICAKFH